MYIQFKELSKYGFFAIETTKDAGNMKEKQFLYPLLEKINVDKKYLVKGVQTHSTNILCVDKNTNIDNIENIDGYITDDKDFTLMAYFADCMPMFVIDKNKKVFSLLHGGWRGSSNKILEKAINIFKDKYNSKVEDIIVTFGICISVNNYEIGKDLAIELIKKLNFDTIVVEKEGKYFLNIAEMNKRIAIENGILEKNIIMNNYCTYKDNFYSYRKEKTDKRMVAIIKVGE